MGGIGVADGGGRTRACVTGRQEAIGLPQPKYALQVLGAVAVPVCGKALKLPGRVAGSFGDLGDGESRSQVSGHVDGALVEHNVSHSAGCEVDQRNGRVFGSSQSPLPSPSVEPDHGVEANDTVDQVVRLRS